MYFVMFIINNNNELPITTSMSCRNNVVNFVKIHHENPLDDLFVKYQFCEQNIICSILCTQNIY